MLKVGIWAETLCGPPNGTRTIISQLVQSLAADGDFRVTLICPENGDAERLRSEFSSRQVSILMAPRGKWHYRIRWLLGLDSLSMLAGQHDVWLSGWHWPLGRKDVPFLAILHDIRILEEGARVSASLVRRFAWRILIMLSIAAGLQRARRVVCVSEFSRARLTQLFPRYSKKYQTIHNGIDIAYWSTKPVPTVVQAAKQHAGLPPSANYVLTLGAHTDHKNFPRLIQAFAGLVDESSRLTSDAPYLVIVGRHGLATPDIRRQVTEDRIGERVLLPGTLSALDVHALMHEAKLFVFPSMYEGFGIPVLEAFAAGTPVIASDICALREVARDAALFVDPFDTQALTRAMLETWHDSTLRAQLATLGRRRVQSFASSQMIARYRNILRDVASPNTWS